MILSVTIWNTRLYDPVRHGMSYPESDGQDHKTMTDDKIQAGFNFVTAREFAPGGISLYL